MNPLFKIFLICLSILSFSHAQNNGEVLVNKNDSIKSDIALKKKTLLDQKNELNLDTVNVGNDDFFSPFIWEGTSAFDSGDETVKDQIDTRDFASDEFYMRNIDREEFEQERILMLFRDDSKKTGFKTWTKSGLVSKVLIPSTAQEDEEDLKKKP